MQQLLSFGCLPLAVKIEDILSILKYNATVATHSWMCCTKICLCICTKHVFSTYTACTLLTHARRGARFVLVLISGASLGFLGEKNVGVTWCGVCTELNATQR